MPSCPVAQGSEVQPAQAQADGPYFCLQGRLAAELRVPHIFRAAPRRGPPACAAAGPEDGECGPVLSGESVPLACVRGVPGHSCTWRQCLPAQTCLLQAELHPNLSLVAVILKLPPGRDCSAPFTDEEIKA